jgi:hypothetical protein
MKITEFGIGMDINDEHLSKQCSPIEVAEFEIEMNNNDEH